MDVKINEIRPYGEQFEYLLLKGEIDEHKFTVNIYPKDKVVMDAYIEITTMNLSSYEIYEVLIPQYQLKLHEYFNKNMKYIKILKDTINYMDNGLNEYENGTKNISTSIRNKTLQYYECVLNEKFDRYTSFTIKDECEFRLDEHLGGK